MRVITPIAVSLLLIACDASQSKPSPETVGEAAQNLRYFHDARTGLCFAAVSQLNGELIMQVQVTNVPCNSEVLKLIGGKE